jgi:hypothetical protein
MTGPLNLNDCPVPVDRPNRLWQNSHQLLKVVLRRLANLAKGQLHLTITRLYRSSKVVACIFKLRGSTPIRDGIAQISNELNQITSLYFASIGRELSFRLLVLQLGALIKEVSIVGSIYRLLLRAV